MNVPANLKYSNDHEWCRIEGDTAVIGITDFAQSQLGDIVFVDVPTVGETLAAGESKTVHGSEGMMLIYCGVGEVHVIVGDESVALKADEAARLDGYAGEIKLCSKEGAKLMLAKAKEI